MTIFDIISGNYCDRFSTFCYRKWVGYTMRIFDFNIDQGSNKHFFHFLTIPYEKVIDFHAQMLNNRSLLRTKCQVMELSSIIKTMCIKLTVRNRYSQTKSFGRAK